MNFGADLRVGLFLWSMAESCKSLTASAELS